MSLIHTREGDQATVSFGVGLRVLSYPANFTLKFENHSDLTVAELVPWPPAAAWNGPEDGLPPVGLEVLTDHAGRTFKVKILAYAPKNGKTAVMVEENEPGDNKGCLFAWMAHMCNFRPIRTAEKRAAEEREQQIEKMMGHVKSGTGLRALCTQLYDAGARMPGEGSKA